MDASAGGGSAPRDQGEPTGSRLPSTVAEGGRRTIGYGEYAVEAGRILCNLPDELRGFGQIPCAQRSLYTGVLAGGITTLVSVVLTGTARGSC